MRQAPPISYKELQKEAKRRGIPANMKRTFLESAIEASADNNRDMLNSIVQHHKSQRKRRSNKSAKAFEVPSPTPTQTPFQPQPCKRARNLAGVADTIAVASPVQLLPSSPNSSPYFYKQNDDVVDDDSSDFHPDSTSTPNRPSSVGNANHLANNYSGSGSSNQRCQYVRTYDVCEPCEMPTFVTSCLPSCASFALLAKNHTYPENMIFEGKNETSLIYGADRCTALSILKQSLAPATTYQQHQSSVYEYDTNAAANFDFIRQNCCSMQTICSNANAGDTIDDDANIVPLSAAYRCPPFGYSSPSPSSLSSLSLNRLLDNNSQLNDMRSDFINPLASCSLNATFVDNFRTIPANLGVARTNTVVDRPTPAYRFNTMPMDRNIADATSVDAEFDSDSDTETLSLTDEIVNLFHSRAESTASPSASSGAMLFLGASNATNGGCCNFENRSVLGNNNATAAVATTTITRDGCVGCGDGDDFYFQNEKRFDVRGIVGPTTTTTAAGLVHQPVHRSRSPGYDLLPSISTLLPEYKIHAYREGHYSQANDVRARIASSAPIPPRGSSSVQVELSCPCEQTATVSHWTPSSQTAVDSTKNISSIPYLCANSFSQPCLRSHSSKTYFSAKSPPSSVLSSSSSSSSSSSPQQPPPSPSSSSSSSSSLIMGNFGEAAFDVFDEAVRVTMTNACKTKAAAVDPTLAATCERWSSLEEKSASLVLKQETVAIQGSTINNSAKTDIDYCAESLEIKMNYSTVCRSKVQRIDVDLDDDLPVFSYRSCNNKAHGCNVIIYSEESARVHEKECFYQMVHCPADECNWCGVLSSLTDHIYLCHKSNLNIGNDLVFVLDRNERDAPPFATYFQLYEGTIFVISMHVTEKKCIATMQYLPEIETADYRNRCPKGTMQLVYFSDQVQSKCWKGVVRPYFENDQTLYQKGNILQSTIGDSKNIVVRVLIEQATITSI